MAEAARSLEEPGENQPPQHTGLRSIQGGAKHTGSTSPAGKLSVVPPERAAADKTAAQTNAAPGRPQAINGGGLGDGKPAGQLKSVPSPETSKASGASAKPDNSNAAAATLGGSSHSGGLASQTASTPKNFAAGSKTSDTTSAKSNAAKPAAKSGGLGGRAQVVSNQLKKRSTQIRIAIGVVLALLAILGFLISIPFKLIHIGHVLLDPNSAGNDHTNSQIEDKLFQHFFTDAKTETGRKKFKSGRPLQDFMANNRANKFQDLLKKQGGIDMTFDKAGNLTGFEKDGKSVSNFEDKGMWESRAEISATVKENISPLRPLKRVLYTRVMRAQARVSFKLWAIDKGKSLLQQLSDKVLKGDLGDGIASPSDVSDTPPNDDKNSQAYKDWEAARAAQADAAAADAQDTKGATQAEADSFKAKPDKVAARKAAIGKFRASALGKGLTWTGYATIYCMVRSIILSVTTHDTHYVDRVEALVREGNLLLTAVNEMEEGHVPDLGVFDQYMQRFDGDPNADSGTTDGKSFDKAAAWKRNTGQSVDASPTLTKNPKSAPNPNYNPDLPAAANPNPGTLDTLQSFVDDFFNLPGENTVCKVLTGWLGWVIGGVELVVSVVDGGTSDAAALVASTAFIYYVTSHILPAVMDRANNLAVTGVDSAVDTTNIEDAGLNLSEKIYGRTLGDRAGTDAENAAINDAAANDQVQIAKSKGWTYRAFAIDNTHSLFSQFVAMVPASPAGAVAAISDHISAFSNLPNAMSTLANLFFHPAVATAAGPTLDPYGFRASVTTDQEVEDSDPYVYENLLYSPIPLPGQTLPPDNADGSPLTPAQLTGVAYQKPDGTALTRIDMLGDPWNYSPDDNAGGDDSSSTDLMHCFVNKFRDPTGDTKVDDPICLDLGYLTKLGPNPLTTDQPAVNPGPDQIDGIIYCQENKICGLPWTNTLPKMCDNDITKQCGTVVVNDFDVYRLYLKYVMLTRGMDCETTDTDCFQGTGSGSSTDTTTTTASSTIDLSTIYNDSSSVACAPGTTDDGIQDGYHNNVVVKIRTCELPNMPQAGGPNGHAQVNSRVSGAFLNLITAATKAGIPMSSDSSFRTMAEQQALWVEKGENPVLVAAPGTSNHQMGLAIDFGGAATGNTIFNWLSANAGTYGIKNYPAEAWHWSPTGN